MNCPACGDSATTPRFPKPGGTYAACDGCGLTRLDPVPSADDAAALYGEAYFEDGSDGGYAGYDAAEAAHRHNARAHLTRLHALGAARGELIEVGSATGWFLSEAQAAGWRVQGIEVSDHARAIAAERTGAEMHASITEADDAVAHASCDAVVAVQVLEHLVDPAATLATFARWLTPRGILLIETWDAGSRTARAFGSRWQQLTPPSVIWLFDRPSLERILTDAGFTDITITATSKRVGVASVLELVASKSPRLASLLRRPLASERVERAVVPYKLGDLITVTAHRTP